MRILFVSRGVNPVGRGVTGGAEHVIFKLASQAAANGHDVHLISDVNPDSEIPSGLTIHPVALPRWLTGRLRASGFFFWILLHLIGNFAAWWRASRAIRSAREPFDIIHCHGSLSGLLLSFTKRKRPLVYTEHDSTPWSCRYPGFLQPRVRKILYSMVNVWLYRRAATVLVLYEGHREELINRWSINPVKVGVVPNGVDSVAFSPEARTERGELTRNGRDYLLFVGRLDSRKGVDTLIRAVAETSLRCVIVGDGPEKNRLTRLARRLQIGDRVEFPGRVDHDRLPEYYRGARIFVLPSHSEAFPLTMLEAMACATPVVASRVGVSEDLLTRTDAGLLFDPGDHNDLARQIESLSDVALAEKLGRNGRASVEASFTWDRAAQVMHRVYEGVTGSPAQARPMQSRSVNEYVEPGSDDASRNIDSRA